MAGGRPSIYTPKLLEKARDYVLNYANYGDMIPSIAGLACELSISRDTCHAWAKDEDKPEFSDIIRDIAQAQERKLVNGGLSGDLNPQITKLVLAKHGYSDKQEIDHTSSDGSMSQQHNVTIELVKPNGANQSTDT